MHVPSATPRQHGEEGEDGRIRSRLTVSDLPEPPGLPLLGHLPALARGGTMHRTLNEWRDRFGPTFRVRLGRKDAVVTSAPAILDTVLRERPDTFRRARSLSDLIAELGASGLFDSEGADWQRLRRMATRGLSSAQLRDSYSAIARSTGRLRERWEAMAGERVPVLEDLMRYTLDVTVALTMGHDLDAVRRADEDGLHQRLPLVFDTLTKRMNSPVPYWRWVRLPADRRVDAVVAEAGALIRELYADSRHRMGAGEKPRTYLDSLARASLDNDEHITEGDVIGTILNMMIAGEDTAAATTAWAIHHLAGHPEVQQRVRAEAEAVLGADGYPAEPADLARLPYAAAVVNETIRLNPVSPFVLLEAVTDTTVSDGTTDLHIGRGTVIVVLLTHGSDRDPLRYPDPGRFDPERWLSSAARTSPHEQPFMPFGGGPRFCPGRNLALMESTLVVAMTCHRFTVEPDTSAGPVGERVTLAVLPTHLNVRLHPASASDQ